MKTETATPRTDAIAHRGYNESTYIAEMTGLSRQLERENKTFRAAQKACEDCDAPRVDRIAELERELAAERALADRLAESIEWYRLNVGDCNKGGDDGALARDSLAKDIGRNATKAIAAWKESRK
jgi:hypothetical protein